MAAQFADLPEALENTVEIARRCAFRPKKRDPILPQFVPESGRAPDDELRALAREGLAKRLAKHGLHAEGKLYLDRLGYELDVLIRMKLSGYLLLLCDFMNGTRRQRIPVG